MSATGLGTSVASADHWPGQLIIWPGQRSEQAFALLSAACFVPVGEELRMPTRSSACPLQAAQLRRLDGVALGEFIKARGKSATGAG